MQITEGIVFILGVVFVHGVSADLACTQPNVDIDANWQDMASPCIDLMEKQVQTELEAAMTYMSMGAYFAQDNTNRPGFAKMFFESASEEREHATKIISYLLMRGGLKRKLTSLITDPRPLKTTWSNGVEALQMALKLEVSVTKNIREIIKKCENPTPDNEETGFNDYHLVDYLTGDFLEEQYKGQRDIAEKIVTLGKMMKSYGQLGEFLFDKKLLNGTPV